MPPLSARDLLLVWEQAERRRPAERVLVLLAAACPELPDEELAALPLGRREARLFALHQETFGPALDLVVDCPACGEPLEIEVRISDLDAAPGEEPEPGAPLEIEEGGLALRFRRLDGTDLIAAAAAAAAADAADAADTEAARHLLARRAVLAASRDGRAISADDLTAGEIDLLSRRLAAADPRAEVLLDLACPACGHAWQAPLDAAECLWSEIDGAARRLLHEVHALARAYHWRETDILAMSARRRRRYLEILAG